MPEKSYMDVIRGKVKIPKDYFNRAAKKEYVFWARSLIREFLQNSVDAGSSEIHFKFAQDRLLLIVRDDGCGMDKDIILNKLLALGGSFKSKGAVGGFGKAKEILFFAWRYYAIHSKSWLVDGEGPDYAVRDTGDKYYNGTRCAIQFYTIEEFNAVWAAANEYLPRNEIDADIFLNSNRVVYAWGKKKKLRSFPWANVFISPGLSSEASIRVNGLEMFKRYICNSLTKRVIVELNGYSPHVMTANRDGLKYKFSEQLETVLNDLSVNPLSATMNFADDIQELISGKNTLSVPTSLLMMWSNNSLESPVSEERFIPGLQIPNTNRSEFELSDFDYNFIIRRSQKYDKKRMDEFMNDPAALPLARIWTNLIFEVVLANEIPVKCFITGFLFSDRALGLCVGNSDNPIILFNPISGVILGAANEGIDHMRAVMEDTAYHELAHINCRKHDEIFVMLAEKYRRNHREWKRKKNSNRIINWKKLLRV